MRTSVIDISPLYYVLLAFLIVHTIAHQTTNRETLEFVIHGKGKGPRKGCNYKDHQNIPITLQCPKPGNSLALPPLPDLEQEVLQFADQRLAVVYPVIQKFKSIIASDPLGITKTWVGSDICSYKGFFCESPPDNKTAIAVASIDFNGFQLGAPALDGFLDQLPDIALFHANSNKFAGPFPTAVLGMSGLEFLDIRFNYFSGAVPPQIFTLNLDCLFINNNNFMQNLPDNIGSTHILFLTLANNKFNGPIPRSIFKSLSDLTEVLLLNNQLTGCLPYEIGFLKEATVVDLGNNQLTGPLPFSLACMQKVEQFNFANNLLFGKVPEVVCELGNLVNFSLSDNYFTNVGPFCRILIERGVLDVRNNCIPDLPFQRSIVECAQFFAYPKFCSHMWSYAYIPCMPYIPEMAPSP
ncbi:hypothetical protein Patl1_08903 [Pistacia atlantica]|uniref:Uncharacterized protein n=1 Tax=Pistacia atlantica TaxID=434234 RepID=A0ACC1AHG5_9ROSI|nr:hypothetical protein Patl1_08903 [Pistacia atlantica]